MPSLDKVPTPKKLGVFDVIHRYQHFGATQQGVFFLGFLYVNTFGISLIYLYVGILSSYDVVSF